MPRLLTSEFIAASPHERRTSKSLSEFDSSATRMPQWRGRADLQVNPDLVDAGLLEMMVEVAKAFAETGNENTAKFLIDVARQLAEAFGLSSLLFLLQVLQAIGESEGKPETVYSLLQKNLDQLSNSAH